MRRGRVTRMSEDRGMTRAFLAAVALAGFGLFAAPAASPFLVPDPVPPTVHQLLGQKLVVSMNGTTPSASLIRRAHNGAIGGVIIHTTNFTSATNLRAITARLQRAAANGGQPPLLIAVDQEGGPVKTISWIPPMISPRRMGELGSSDVAHRQGRRTGLALLDLGVNVDLAPVADVPASTSSFMYLQGRTWSFGASKTSRLANAFALGLADGGALASMKHFPGLGFARLNTDTNVVHITATKRKLSPGLRPYRAAVTNGVPLVMLSNAVYDTYDRRHAAGWSRVVGMKLLRGQLGFRGVTITDSLDGAAHARGIAVNRLAVRAARAGTDMLLLTGSEAASRSAYKSLLEAVSEGHISVTRLQASYQRILALKAGL
jgi:beta-N-acetylhexosaminidase